MLTLKSLERDVARRIERVQKMMQERDIGALVVVGGGGGAGGAARYISNVRLWGGTGYVVLGAEDPYPWATASTPYQARWAREETTTLRERIESPDDPIGRVAGLAKGYARKSKRIGVVNLDSQLAMAQYRKLKDTLGDFEIVEVTREYNGIRQIKTPFELEAMQQIGDILDKSMDVFQETAHVGARYWDVAAATEAYVRAQGCLFGRIKLSLENTPYTIPPPLDLRMREDDIILWEIVYTSYWGYGLEMTTLFSFHDLPDDIASLLDGYLQAVDSSSAMARPGNTFQMISDANDSTLRELGFPVAGKHTPDCHTTGLGGEHISSLGAPGFVLQSNMTLSFHPGTVLENDRGLLISDNFVVTSEGGVRLSPHTADRYHMLLCS